MMMTVDEKLHAYAKNQKDRNIDEKKLQQTIIKSKEAYWDGEIERNMSWLEFLYQQASYIQKHWWFAQGAVLLILWMTMFLSDSSIYTRRCMGILAPSFVILILPELWKNRSNGAMEVEGATFFSIKNICVIHFFSFLVTLRGAYRYVGSLTRPVTGLRAKPLRLETGQFRVTLPLNHIVAYPGGKARIVSKIYNYFSSFSACLVGSYKCKRNSRMIRYKNIEIEKITVYFPPRLC